MSAARLGKCLGRWPRCKKHFWVFQMSSQCFCCRRKRIGSCEKIENLIGQLQSSYGL